MDLNTLRESLTPEQMQYLIEHPDVLKVLYQSHFAPTPPTPAAAPPMPLQSTIRSPPRIIGLKMPFDMDTNFERILELAHSEWDQTFK